MRTDRRTFITTLYSDILSQESWKRYAACKGMTALFFTDRYTPEQAEAKRICATCPVKRECQEYGLKLPQETGGIWGGLNQNERKRMRRRHASSAVQAVRRDVG
jgi:WhiB family redox-sensing transcriptional regulator